MQTLNYNLDLAYSMLVYSLESLSQSFDNFELIWEDYNPEIKNELGLSSFQNRFGCSRGYTRNSIKVQQLTIATTIY